MESPPENALAVRDSSNWYVGKDLLLNSFQAPSGVAFNHHDFSVQKGNKGVSFYPGFYLLINLVFVLIF